MGHLDGLRLLFSFYWNNFWRFQRELPVWLRNPDVFNTLLGEHRTHHSKEELKLELSAKTATEFNADYDRLKSQIRDCSNTEREFKTSMLIMLVIRLVSIGLAFSGNIPLTVACMALQFAVLPYSLFISATMLLAFLPAMFFSHYVSWGLLRLLLYPVPAALRDLLMVEIDGSFVFAFFAIDFALCCVCQFGGTTCGPTVQWDFSRVLKHMVFGFLNSKTYWLVLLPTLLGTRIDGGIWLLDMALGLQPRAAKLISRHFGHWAIFFYIQHRVGHLPRVYEEAHKFHHYLHDSTAFDAHIYGSGAPEEFFALLLEMLTPFTLGIAPPSLGYHILMISWTNKTGHTRKEESSGGLNHHTDHHVLHNKNFGIYNSLMDLYFGTNATPGTNEFAEYIVSLGAAADSADKVAFTFKPNDSKPGIKEIVEGYYKADLLSILRLVKRVIIPAQKAA